MKKWREASTVIIAAKNSLKPSHCDYRILTARRNVESRFMPNSHVFPGGAVDPEDSSQEWEKLHKKLNFSTKLHDFKIFSDKLELFKTPKNEYLPRYLSLRIAAIREAFEECGILLCRSNNTSINSTNGYGTIIETKQDYRERPFLEICKDLQCFPDVWSLHEGRNWLTPNHLPKRFDTAFFFVALNKIPNTVMDPREVSEIKVQYNTYKNLIH
jgi:nucleoside diphosphate-linked moiety X motif protein 19